MRLTVPTDFDILRALSDGHRNNAINIAAELDEIGRTSTRGCRCWPTYGLVERVGPAPNSGLYEITERGRIAGANQAAYEDDDQDFEALIDREAGASA